MPVIKLNNNVELGVDGYLKSQLDSVTWNINSDWDFVFIITGDGMVRTGKSVFAMQIAAYLANKLGTEFTLDNVFFESQDMIITAQTKPKNTVFVYDEAREGLASAKRFSKIQQDLIDFFNECGQLNQVFILVLPDFFSLNWELATNRSEFLINVYRNENAVERFLKGEKEKSPVTVFERGFFEFFNRKKKSELYYLGKRSGLRKYGMVTPNFRGRFANTYVLDETSYRQKKKEKLLRFNSLHQEESKTKVKCNRFDKGLWTLLNWNKGRLKEIQRRNSLPDDFFSEIKQELKQKLIDGGVFTKVDLESIPD